MGWLSGVYHSIFSKRAMVDKDCEEKLKKIRTGNKLFEELRKGCRDIEEYDRKINLLKANDLVDNKTIDVLETEMGIKKLKALKEAGINIDKKFKDRLLEDKR